MTATNPLYPELDTPCLILDHAAFEANLAKLQRAVTAADKDLRPHAKTHKCSRIASQQLAAGAVGICVAKVSEAENLIRAGIRNVLVTGPTANPSAVRRLVDLLDRDPGLLIAIDSAAGLDALHSELTRRERTMRVLLDVDVGHERTGVHPRHASDFARGLIKRSPRTELVGIQAYAGHLQHITNYDERRDCSLAALATAADVLRAVQVFAPSCRILSGSGTGTVEFDLAERAMTEFQAGSYVFMDEEYRQIGSAANPGQFADFAPALRVLTSVVSANHATHVTVDAGLKALYRDGAVPAIHPARGSSFAYDWFGDEYGKLTPTSPGLPLPQVGTRFELITSHCDPTVNLYDTINVVSNQRVIDQWPLDLRGCSQ